MDNFRGIICILVEQNSSVMPLYLGPYIRKFRKLMRYLYRDYKFRALVQGGSRD